MVLDARLFAGRQNKLSVNSIRQGQSQQRQREDNVGGCSGKVGYKDDIFVHFTARDLPLWVLKWGVFQELPFSSMATGTQEAVLEERSARNVITKSIPIHLCVMNVLMINVYV